VKATTGSVPNRAVAGGLDLLDILNVFLLFLSLFGGRGA
jgi:hypothetical protein